MLTDDMISKYNFDTNFTVKNIETEHGTGTGIYYLGRNLECYYLVGQYTSLLSWVESSMKWADPYFSRQPGTDNPGGDDSILLYDGSQDPQIS